MRNQPWGHCAPKGRHHVSNDYQEVEQHDGGLATGVRPIVPPAGQYGTGDQRQPHGEFAQENTIRRQRRRASK